MGGDRSRDKMYVIIEPIQSGTFSTVYRGWDRRGQRYVAMKVMTKCNYRDEIDTMRQLGGSHPNVCSMLDYYGDANHYILVLEHCQLGDLCDFVEMSKRRGLENFSFNVCQLARQLSSAIIYAHSLGIAHRDIKPENILITAEGNVKLGDWGHAIRSRWSDETNIGTDAYRGPETFTGERYDTFRADYWSFGLTLLYAAFGETPFKCLKDAGGKTTSYVWSCENFASFVRDPYQFLYQFFVKPLSQTDSSGTTTFRISPQEYGRKLPISEVIFHCRAIADYLLNVEADHRDIFEYIITERKCPRDTSSENSLNYSLKLPPSLRIRG